MASDRHGNIIMNLASREYAKCVEKYLRAEDLFITCIFGELVQDKIVQKGTLAKMARGEMVRFMAENSIEEPEQVKCFDRLGSHFAYEMSSETEYVFLKN